MLIVHDECDRVKSDCLITMAPYLSVECEVGILRWHLVF